MKNLLLLSFVLLLFANCGNAPKTVEKQPEIKTDTAKKEVLSHWTTEEPKKVSQIVETDTIIKAFGERFKIVCRENNYGGNGILSIINLNNKKIIAQDSIYLDFGLLLERKDYNKDGVKDIILYSHSGARGANGFYYLYLSNIRTKTFHFVKDFDTAPSPEADTSGMVIYHPVAGNGVGHWFYAIQSDYSMKKINESDVWTTYIYDDTSEDLKQEQQDKKAYRKAYNKAWAKFKKMK